MAILSDLKTRGCQDILIVVTDGLKGMREALAAVYPQTTLQTCIVHLIRHSLDCAKWKERKPRATALRPMYAAATVSQRRRRHKTDLACAAEHHGLWERTSHHWRAAMNQFAILYEDRFPPSPA